MSVWHSHRFHRASEDVPESMEHAWVSEAKLNMKYQVRCPAMVLSVVALELTMVMSVNLPETYQAEALLIRTPKIRRCCIANMIIPSPKRVSTGLPAEQRAWYTKKIGLPKGWYMPLTAIYAFCTQNINITEWFASI